MTTTSQRSGRPIRRAAGARPRPPWLTGTSVREPRSGCAACRERGDEHVGHGRAGTRIACPRDLVPAPALEGVLRRGSRREHGKCRSFFAAAAEDEVVQGLADALAAP